MRTRAVDENGNIVFISDAEKGRIYFDDMFPESELIPVKGEIRQWHYRYRDGSADRDTWANEGNSMSEWHIQQQNLFPENEREVPVFPHRADVLTGGNTVIEFQHSNISAEEIKERTDFYIKEVGAIIWVIDCTDIVREFKNNEYGLTKRSFIGGLKMQPNQEIFIYAGRPGFEYIHVRKVYENWVRFEGFKLGVQHFLNFVHNCVAQRVVSVVRDWKEIEENILREERYFEEEQERAEKEALEYKKRIEASKVNQFNRRLDSLIEEMNHIVEEFKREIAVRKNALHHKTSDPYYYARICVEHEMFGGDSYDNGRNQTTVNNA